MEVINPPDVGGDFCAQINFLCSMISSGQDAYEAEQRILQLIDSSGGLQTLLEFIAMDNQPAEARFVLVEVVRSSFAKDSQFGPVQHTVIHGILVPALSPQNQQHLANQRAIVCSFLELLAIKADSMPELLVRNH